MLDDGFKLSLDKIFHNKLVENAEVFSVPGFKDD
jgi:hypothetical protein